MSNKYQFNHCCLMNESYIMLDDFLDKKLLVREAPASTPIISIGPRKRSKIFYDLANKSSMDSDGQKPDDFVYHFRSTSDEEDDYLNSVLVELRCGNNDKDTEAFLQERFPISTRNFFIQKVGDRIFFEFENTSLIDDFLDRFSNDEIRFTPWVKNHLKYEAKSFDMKSNFCALLSIDTLIPVRMVKCALEKFFGSMTLVNYITDDIGFPIKQLQLMFASKDDMKKAVSQKTFKIVIDKSTIVTCTVDPVHCSNICSVCQLQADNLFCRTCYAALCYSCWAHEHSKLNELHEFV